ncbi:hypothetical protein [Virgibacillus sediminis]|uniref:Uncharacterized protein n=1 Tax=Virgibacillus sediminis TaxID=202260 RepID=A0ABV7A6H8_9BACI
MDNELTKQVSVLEIPDDIGYWLLRADGGKYYDDFFLNNFIAISDNKISLEKLRDYQENSIAGITLDHYKQVYKDTYSDWSNQQIAHAASRTEKFCDEMKVGDLVLVPAKRSNSFLLGVISGEVYEITDDDLNSGKHIHYAINPYFKRRKMNWIKEIPRSEISEKLYWMLSAHQTIFDLQDHKEYINQLLAPIYIQNGSCHGTVKISKREGLNSDEWYDLHSTIKKYTDLTSEEVIVKSNVQSPGLLEFISNNLASIMAITTVLGGVLIGEVNLLGIKVKGILPYYQSHKKQKIEMEIMEEDKKAKQLENHKAEFDLHREKEIWEIKKETEAEQLREQLRISSFDAGKIIANQMQTDTSENPNGDEL